MNNLSMSIERRYKIKKGSPVIGKTLGKIENENNVEITACYSFGFSIPPQTRTLNY